MRRTHGCLGEPAFAVSARSPTSLCPRAPLPHRLSPAGFLLNRVGGSPMSSPALVLRGSFAASTCSTPVLPSLAS